jgi:hypothetical protein
MKLLSPWRRRTRTGDPEPSAAGGSRLRWLLGVACAWILAWALCGFRVLLQIKDKPHPFLPALEVGPTILKAVTEWALAALAAYLIVGLVVGLVGKLFTSDRHGTNLARHLGFKAGFGLGLGGAAFLHGVLYAMVPMALVGLPGLKHLPIGLTLLLFLGGGGWLILRAFRAESVRHHGLRLLAYLAFLALLPQVPHDILRRAMPLPPPLPKDAPRVLVIGIDGVRRDLFERHMPHWKAPDGVQPACVAPATRRSWSMLLGKDPEKLKYSIIMPFQSDLGHPEAFTLLALARQQNLRTAWAIDDSLTAGFGNQPNWFTTVRESPGGWKYWFTLGMGTVFPVFSWTQNIVAPIENTNPWSDISAYWRDVGRLAETHHWVFTHTCSLHEPIRMNLWEMQTFRPWRWLLDSAWSYRPYASSTEAVTDSNPRLDMRSSALGHYSIRMRKVLLNLEPAIRGWERRFPRLSGVVTSDHGEKHPTVEDETGQVLTHAEGYHGFDLDPNSIWVPLHPFGATRTSFKPNDTFTWIELRDAIRDWTDLDGQLVLKGRQGPFLIQFPTIRAVQLETEEAQASGSDLGIDPKELLDTLSIFDNGIWFASDARAETFKSRKCSSGLVQGADLVLFNPTKGNRFERGAFTGYKAKSASVVDKEAMDRELLPFLSALPQPLTLPGRKSDTP